MTADPTARDLLRIAVDYADQARALGESFDGPRRQERFGSLLRVADTFANLARTAAFVEAGEPATAVGEETDAFATCPTCGHPEAAHPGGKCLRCRRYGGLCETPYVVMCPGPGYCPHRDGGDGHKHMSDGRVLPVDAGALVDVDAINADLRRRLQSPNRGPFVERPGGTVNVRREQTTTFGPPDDATAEIPRKATWSDDRCKVTNLGRRCLLVAGHLEGPNGHGHAFAPLVPAGPDRFA